MPTRFDCPCSLGDLHVIQSFYDQFMYLLQVVYELDKMGRW